MPKFRNGLAKVGDYYHYKFTLKKKQHHGSTGHTRLDAAKEWLRVLREDMVNEAAGITPRAKVPTLGEAVDQWEAEAKALGKSASHIRNTTKDIRKHFADLLETRLHLCSTQEVRACRTAFLEAGNTIGGANGIIRSLNTVMGWAIKGGIIQQKPYTVKLERVQETPSISLPTSRLVELFEAMEAVGAPENAIRLARMMVGLGLRESEARNAWIEHLDLEKRTFTPFDPVEGTKGKEAEQLPVPKWLADDLKAWIGDRKTGLILPGRLGTAHKREYALPYIKAAGERMGIPGLTCHKLRATYATLLSEEGLPLQTVQKALRHKDARTTLKYLVPNLGAVRGAADSIGRKSGLDGSIGTTIEKGPRKRRKQA